MILHPRLKNTGTWLFREPRYVWLCIFVCALSVGVMIQQGATEPAVRLIGLVLQLGGIVTVVWGIVETRQFFGMQSPLRAFKEWVSRFPLRRQTAISAVSATLEGGFTISARASSSWPIDPTTDLEQRVLTLERNLPLTQQRISTVENEFERVTQELRGELKSEAQHRLALSEHVQSQLLTYGTGGLHISAIGAVWVFLGTVLGTASPEISSWLK